MDSYLVVVVALVAIGIMEFLDWVVPHLERKREVQKWEKIAKNFIEDYGYNRAKTLCLEHHKPWVATLENGVPFCEEYLPFLDTYVLGSNIHCFGKYPG